MKVNYSIYAHTDDSEIHRANAQDILDEINDGEITNENIRDVVNKLAEAESEVENAGADMVRAAAVIAMHREKLEASIIGSSVDEAA